MKSIFVNLGLFLLIWFCAEQIFFAIRNSKKHEGVEKYSKTHFTSLVFTSAMTL